MRTGICWYQELRMVENFCSARTTGGLHGVYNIWQSRMARIPLSPIWQKGRFGSIKNDGPHSAETKFVYQDRSGGKTEFMWGFLFKLLCFSANRFFYTGKKFAYQYIFISSVVDPARMFWTSRIRTRQYLYETGSGFFNHLAKKVWKTLILLYCDFFMNTVRYLVL